MYECMLRLSPNDPLTAFSVVGLLAVGPFEELHKMKRFDGYLPDPECQMKLHMQHRFYFDPPEFQVNSQCHFLALKFLFRQSSSQTKTPFTLATIALRLTRCLFMWLPTRATTKLSLQKAPTSWPLSKTTFG